MVKTRWAVSAALASTLMLASYGCSPCEEKVLKQVTSPTEEYIASLYNSDCGATAPFYTVVQLRPAHERLSVKGEGKVLIFEDDIPVGIEWTGSHELTLTLSPTSIEPAVKNDSWRDVKVFYEYSEVVQRK